MAVQGGTRDIKILQGHLSVAALVAKCFENEDRCEAPVKVVSEMFVEKEVGARDQRCAKVSLVASDRGGWKYELMERDALGGAVVVEVLDSKTLQAHAQQV
jgi:hypothetical protein